jgi:hypothetical protein
MAKQSASSRQAVPIDPTSYPQAVDPEWLFKGSFGIGRALPHLFICPENGLPGSVGRSLKGRRLSEIRHGLQ